MLISGIKLPPDHTSEELEAQIRKKYGKSKFEYVIQKKSVDARFGKVNFVYSVEAFDENTIQKPR